MFLILKIMMTDLTREDIVVVLSKIDMLQDSLDHIRQCDAIWKDLEMIRRLERIGKDIEKLHEELDNTI